MGTSLRKYAERALSGCAAAGAGAERTLLAGAADAPLKQQLATTNAVAAMMDLQLIRHFPDGPQEKAD